jgi:uncharacterized membrane protein
MSEKIELALAPARLQIFRGEKGEATLNLRNRGQSVDQFTVSVDGISPEWYSLPVSSVALFPNDQDSTKIIISIPEESEIKEKSYQVKIRVSSQENPSEATTVDLLLEIGIVPTLQLDIAPSQINGRRGNYHLMITNPGDREVKVNLKMTNPNRRLKLTASSENLNVAPGQKTEADIEAKLNWLVWIVPSRIYQFQVALQPVERIEMAPVSAGGQISSQPWYHIFSKIRLPWLARAPLIKEFKVTTDDKREFTFSWQIQRAKNVKFDGVPVDHQGEISVRPVESRQYVLTASNRNGAISQSKDINPIPLPKAKTSNNIKVTLSVPRMQVQAGVIPAVLSAQIQNQSDIVDKFKIEVEGLDDSWYSRSASSIALMPKISELVQITFNPPRKKGVKAGLYPFAITVHSQSSSGESTSVLGQLEILPAIEIKTKVNPYRITARRKGSFRVSLSNTSVSDASLSLEATDLDEGCRFHFSQDRIHVAAWKNIEIPFVVRPKKNSIIGEVKRYDINVTAAVDGVSQPQVANCELTHRPLMKDWKPIWRTLRAIIAIVIVVIAVYYLLKMGGGWHVLSESPKTWLDNWVHTIVGWFPQ